MSVIASMCTIPVRKGSFKQVAQRILHEQTQPVDQLHVWLNGYRAVDPDLPQDPRLQYHLEPANPGPWVRYRAADALDEDDFLVTLDDDLLYPPDYIERGITELESVGKGKAVCFGGIRWDPLDEVHLYGSHRNQYGFDKALTVYQKVALPMGGVSFFQAGLVQSATMLILSVSGFQTNDDMMIGYKLQQRGVQIICCPKPADWIRELADSRDEHALFIRDRAIRVETFQQMVENLGFDPTVERLADILKKPRRLLVLADVCPPLPGSEPLDEQLRDLCDDDASVHLLAVVRASQGSKVQQYVNIPYEIHAVSVPEPGGRFDALAPVRAWRNWRVVRSRRRNWVSRLETVISLLKPTQILHYSQGSLLATQCVKGEIGYTSPLWPSSNTLSITPKDFPPDRLPTKIIPNDHSRQSSATKLVLELVSQGARFSNVLDLGCGNGTSREFFKELSPDINWFGIDLISSPEVDSRNQSIDGICAYDGANLPFPNDCFNFIYSRQVLEHVYDPINLMQELARVARPGCLFVGSVSQLELYHTYSTWNWTPYGLCRCLGEAGFQLLLLRPGIDALTLGLRAQGLRNRFMNRFLENESPINFIISVAGWIMKKRLFAINAQKLRFAGHLCFVAQKDGD